MIYENLIRIVYPSSYVGIARELTRFRSGICETDILDKEWILHEENAITMRILEVINVWTDMKKM